MSFGFSIGDFVAVTELTRRIRKDFAGAPKQFEAISTEVRSLSYVLQDVEVAVSSQDLDAQQAAELQSIAQGANELLMELGSTLAKYSELESSAHGIVGRAKRVWKRLKWEPDDIRDLRSRISSNTALLNAFTAQRARTQVVQLVHRQDDHERQSILDWLSPTDYGKQQSDLISRRQPGTGNWLLEAPSYKSWLEAPKPSTLFCPGIPGAGKTILAAVVVDELEKRFQNDAETGYCYIYFNYKRSADQRPLEVIRSLLRQLSRQRQDVLESVRTIWSQHRGSQNIPSFDIIREVLRSVSTFFTKLYIVIDALDECQESEGFRSKILEVLLDVQTSANVNLLLTSRPIANVVQELENCCSLSIRADEGDVRTYLESRISRMPKFIQRNQELQEQIVETIVSAVDGMFLLAQLHLDSLTDRTSIKDVKQVLARLPTGSDAYDKAYEEAMERINSQSEGLRNLAAKVLPWILFSKRSLSMTELQHALAVEIDTSELDHDNIPDVDQIVSVCAGLVTLDEENQVVRLVHYTVQEYFSRTKTRWFSKAEGNILCACITYLSYTQFKSGPCIDTRGYYHTEDSRITEGRDRDGYEVGWAPDWEELLKKKEQEEKNEESEDYEERVKRNPLYRYAAEFWGHHARLAPSAAEQVIAFLTDSSKEANLRASVQCLVLENQNLWESSWHTYSDAGGQDWHTSALHLAAYFGLEEVSKKLLDEGMSPNLKDYASKRPLTWAAISGQVLIVKLLVEQGELRPDSVDNQRCSPLLYAVSGGYASITQMLVDTGEVNVNRVDGSRYSFPLLIACQEGHEDVVRALLRDPKLDINQQSPTGRSGLAVAAEKGHQSIVELLLKTEGIIVKTVEAIGWTPLAYAIRNGHEAVARLLIDAGADVSRKTKDGSFLLHIAVHSREAKMVKLALETGKVDIDAIDRARRTPLWLAAYSANEEMVEMILETKKVNIDWKGEHGMTPLTWAVANKKGGMVKMLLNAGEVNVESVDLTGQTPLSRAAAEDDTEILGMLQEYKNGRRKFDWGKIPVIITRRSELACLRHFSG